MVEQRQTGKMTTEILSDTELRISRTFDAPRALVFKAHSSCEHLRHWWGPARYEIAECDVEFRAGGKWRVVHKGDDGEFAFRGEFREIVEPEKIVWTFEYEGMPGNISIETMTLEERDGKTTLTATSVYPSKEALQAMVESGMEEGAAETYDRLAEYVKTLR